MKDKGVRIQVTEEPLQIRARVFFIMEDGHEEAHSDLLVPTVGKSRDEIEELKIDVRDKIVQKFEELIPGARRLVQ